MLTRWTSDTHHLFLGGAARQEYASSPLIRQTAPSKVKLLWTMVTWPQPCRVSRISTTLQHYQHACYFSVLW